MIIPSPQQTFYPLIRHSAVRKIKDLQELVMAY